MMVVMRRPEDLHQREPSGLIDRVTRRESTKLRLLFTKSHQAGQALGYFFPKVWIRLVARFGFWIEALFMNALRDACKHLGELLLHLAIVPHHERQPAQVGAIGEQL